MSIIAKMNIGGDSCPDLAGRGATSRVALRPNTYFDTACRVYVRVLLPGPSATQMTVVHGDTTVHAFNAFCIDRKPTTPPSRDSTGREGPDSFVLLPLP